MRLRPRLVTLFTCLLGLWLTTAAAMSASAFDPSGAPYRNRSVVPTTPAATLRPDRHYVSLPPAYPLPPPGFRALPGSRSRPMVAEPLPPHGDPVWIPSRTEVLVGVDASGRLIHAREFVPGHFVGRPAHQSVAPTQHLLLPRPAGRPR